MKHYIKTCALVAALALSAADGMAQGLTSGYFTDGYIYRHALNPAYGNDSTQYVALPALGSINVELRGNIGYSDVVRDNPVYGTLSDKKKTTFLNPYLTDPLDGFSTGKNRLGADIDVAILSAGFKAFGGYNTIELNSRTRFNLSLPYELLEMAVNAGNQDYDIGDIRVNAQSYVELGLGHSRKIDDRWRVGAKLKFLFGVADADVRMDGLKAHLTGNTWTLTGDASAHMSMKGFQYKSEMKDYEARDGQYERVNDVDIDGAGLGGFGLAADLGAVFKLNDDWEFSAALQDLGFIHWSNDVYATNPEKTFTFNGFHDTGVHTGDNPIDAQVDSYSDQLSQFYNLRDEGDQGGRTTTLGARLNLAAKYTLPVYRKMEFGLLSATRFLGTHTWTEARLSANWKPLKWLDGGINFAQSTYASSMGWILNVHPAGFNFFVGMNHILGKVSNEFIPLSSNASLSMGFNVTW